MYKITVEPILMLYMLAFMLTNIIEKDFYKSLIGTKHYGSAYLQENFTTDYPEFHQKVIEELSNFIKSSYLIEYSIVLFLMPYYILMNRIYGSKVMILLSLLGKIMFVTGILLCIYMEVTDVYTILLCVVMPSSILGSNILIFANCFHLYAIFNAKKQIKKQQKKLLKKQISDIAKIEDNNRDTNEYVDDNSIRLLSIKKISDDELNNKIYNHEVNKNILINVQWINKLINNTIKNFRTMVDNYKKKILKVDLDININNFMKNIRIKYKIISYIKDMIDNNETIYDYPEIIDCIYKIGAYEHEYISKYDSKKINKIKLLPINYTNENHLITYNTEELELIDYVKKRLTNILINFNNLEDYINDFQPNLIMANNILTYLDEIKAINEETLTYLTYKNEYINKIIKTSGKGRNDADKGRNDADKGIDTDKGRNDTDKGRNDTDKGRNDTDKGRNDANKGIDTDKNRNTNTTIDTTTDIDIDTTEDRISNKNTVTIDYSLLNFVYIICIPIGIYLGKTLYMYINNYMYMYLINLALLYICFMYTALRFKTNITEPNKICDCTSLYDIITFKYTNKKQVLLICLCIFLYMVEREENNVLYLYTQSIFNWNFIEYSNYKTMHVGISCILLLISYIYNKFFTSNKYKIILFGSIICITGQILYILSGKNESIFYFGLFFSPFGILIINNIKSIIPSITTESERINLFIICGIIEQLGCLFFEYILQTFFVELRISIFCISIIAHILIFCLIFLILLCKKK
jgi:SOS response regulatory protein OraA/RecX